MPHFDREATYEDLLNWLESFRPDQLKQTVILQDLTSQARYTIASLFRNDLTQKYEFFVIGFNQEGEDQNDISRLARRN